MSLETKTQTAATAPGVLITCLLAGIPGAGLAGELQLGAYLAGECTACHRLDAAQGGVPSIAGLTEHDFVAAMQAYRSGAREATVMRSIAASLSDREITALARYFRTQEAQP